MGVIVQNSEVESRVFVFANIDSRIEVLLERNPNLSMKDCLPLHGDLCSGWLIDVFHELKSFCVISCIHLQQNLK